MDITPSQWPYVRFWIKALVITESIMLVRSHDLVFLYIVIAALFAGGFLLRVLKIYPGEPEPLSLDSSAVAMALFYAYIAQQLGDSPWRYLLILTSSMIIMPHFYFIAKEK